MIQRKFIYKQTIENKLLLKFKNKKTEKLKIKNSKSHLKIQAIVDIQMYSVNYVFPEHYLIL